MNDRIGYRLACGHYTTGNASSGDVCKQPDCRGLIDLIKAIDSDIVRDAWTDEYRRSKNRMNWRSPTAGTADGFYLVWWMIHSIRG